MLVGPSAFVRCDLGFRSTPDLSFFSTRVRIINFPRPLFFFPYNLSKKCRFLSWAVFGLLLVVIDTFRFGRLDLYLS